MPSKKLRMKSASLFTFLLSDKKAEALVIRPRSPLCSLPHEIRALPPVQKYQKDISANGECALGIEMLFLLIFVVGFSVVVVMIPLLYWLSRP